MVVVVARSGVAVALVSVVAEASLVLENEKVNPDTGDEMGCSEEEEVHPGARSSSLELSRGGR